MSYGSSWPACPATLRLTLAALLIASTTSTTSTPALSPCVASWGKCAGGNMDGTSPCCAEFDSCFLKDATYSQCRPSCPDDNAAWRCGTTAPSLAQGPPAPAPTSATSWELLAPLRSSELSDNDVSGPACPPGAGPWVSASVYEEGARLCLPRRSFLDTRLTSIQVAKSLRRRLSVSRQTATFLRRGRVRCTSSRQTTPLAPLGARRRRG